MDIYTRRRLAALGILAVVLILFVLLIRSCGGDDETPVTTVATTDTTNAPLPKEEYIAQADAICAEANLAIRGVDPEDDDAAQQELELLESQRVRLESLVPEDTSGGLNRFLRSLDDLVDALEVKQAALDRGDETAVTEADAAIAEAKETGEAAAKRYGFEECGRFGQPGSSGSDEEGETEGGAAVPPATEPAPTTTAPAPVEPAPAPAPDTAPPADSGGDTGGTGGGSSGGITP